MMRKITSQIRVGTVPVGGGAPVSVQSMTNTKTADVAATVAQIGRLEKAGCEIVRVAVPDAEAAGALAAIKAQIAIPLIADIHFKHDLALAAIAAGVDGLRINPGNIGSPERVARSTTTVAPSASRGTRRASVSVRASSGRSYGGSMKTRS